MIQASAVVGLSVLVGSMFMGSMLAAQSDDYLLRMSSQIVPEGGVAEVSILLDHSGENLIAGWSLAVCHPPSLEIVALETGETTSRLTPDLLVEDVQGPGWVAGVVISFFGLEQLPSGNGYDLHHAHYFVPAVGVYEVGFCRIGNVDPRINEFLASVSTIPQTESGQIAAMSSTLPRFLRGDCNSDGVVDVVDGMQLLGFV